MVKKVEEVVLGRGLDFWTHKRTPELILLLTLENWICTGFGLRTILVIFSMDDG